MNKDRALVWFRNDLRIRDNEALYNACSNHEEVICIYCFDPRHFGKGLLGMDKTGPFRARFIIQSVESLKAELISKGSDLLVFMEKPEKIIPELCDIYGIKNVYFQSEAGTEESELEEKMENLLISKAVISHSFYGQTLFHPDDLPFPIRQCPDVFSNFRKKIEKECLVRKPLPEPSMIKSPEDLPGTSVPSLFQLGHEEIEEDQRSAFPFSGGEKKGMEHLMSYIWEKELIKSYKETRNGLIGTDYSTKFSPWLSVGALSPRVIYQEIKNYESQKIKNKSTYWLVFELIWRDFFNFQARKLGPALFYEGGLNSLKIRWHNDEGLFDLWKNGKTGIPFIDANINELRKTGFMSNRGRQNVASFLTKDLNINWLWGAAFFESMLIDHDVSSNYGNWQYIAGVGTDPRENRYFNVLKQALNYDGNGNYTRKWLPELSPLVHDDIHKAFKLTPLEKIEKGLEYPDPVHVPKAFRIYIN